MGFSSEGGAGYKLNTNLLLYLVNNITFEMIKYAVYVITYSNQHF